MVFLTVTDLNHSSLKTKQVLAESGFCGVENDLSLSLSIFEESRQIYEVAVAVSVYVFGNFIENLIDDKRAETLEELCGPLLKIRSSLKLWVEYSLVAMSCVLFNVLGLFDALLKFGLKFEVLADRVFGKVLKTLGQFTSFEIRGPHIAGHSAGIDVKCDCDCTGISIDPSLHTIKPYLCVCVVELVVDERSKKERGTRKEGPFLSQELLVGRRGCRKRVHFYSLERQLLHKP